MSDYSQGPGWWQASDGKWYPPSAVPGYAWTAPAQPVPPQQQPYQPAPYPQQPYPQQPVQQPAPYTPAPYQPAPTYGSPTGSKFKVRRYNQRMAQRMARRAGTNEQGVAVCFAFNNLATALIIGVVEDIARLIPTFGDLIEMGIGILSFYFHRIVLVGDQNVYVFRDWPFHIPGKRLAVYPRHPGVVSLGSPKPGAFSRFIRRGQLTFEDGFVVYHGIVWIRRAQYIAQEANVAVAPYQQPYYYPPAQ